MPRKIAEIRILPPLAIARLGSSPIPLVNYDLVTPSDPGPRRIIPAPTIRVDRSTGRAELKTPKSPIKFRDPQGRIRPVAPFLEVWMRFEDEQELRPLTLDTLGAGKIQWRAHVENLKILRRTADENDRIKAETGFFSDHKVYSLLGNCPNFLKGKTLPLGALQYIVPSPELPGIRLRFTPAGGFVYGPPPASDPLIKDAIYDDQKGGWPKYFEPPDALNPDPGPNAPPSRLSTLTTNPSQIFAGETLDPGGDKERLRSWGFLDDECDGIVEAELHIDSRKLSAFARIVAGPPTFAPDSFPVRTVADELEQAMFGPDVNNATLEEAAEIVRRALETVRLINTAQMNKAPLDRGAGMARFDNKIWNRALESIFEPSVADSIAIRARHERVLLALDSGSLAWFARMLRHYDQVADLSTLGRRKMPALMRGADSMHLALTRRQVSKVKKASEP